MAVETAEIERFVSEAKAVAQGKKQIRLVNRVERELAAVLKALNSTGTPDSKMKLISFSDRVHELFMVAELEETHLQSEFHGGLKHAYEEILTLIDTTFDI